MTIVVQVFCTALVVRFSRVRFFDALPKRTWSIVHWSDASDARFLPAKTITVFWRCFSARYFGWRK